MRLTEHLAHLLRDLLERHRVVVWYDGECACSDFVAALHLPNTTIVAGASALAMRRAAEKTYRAINRAATLAEAQRNLLIYLPQPRRAQSEARVHDPFEVFAAVGCTFGDKAAEQLPSLATQAMPELASQIARMAREGTPTLAVLDRLEQGAQYPLVAQALGTTAVTEITVLLVSDAGAPARIDAVAGAHSEQNRPIAGATVILGDLTIQGNVRGVTSLIEPLTVAMENGAQQALVPLANKSQFGGLPEEVLEKIDILFYGDVERAVLKVMIE